MDCCVVYYLLTYLLKYEHRLSQGGQKAPKMPQKYIFNTKLHKISSFFCENTFQEKFLDTPRNTSIIVDVCSAVQVDDDPVTVRLLFEPSGRPVDEQDYYLHEKDNVCVVCGAADSYIRKNIIPREYRKYAAVLFTSVHLSYVIHFSALTLLVVKCLDFVIHRSPLFL